MGGFRGSQGVEGPVDGSCGLSKRGALTTCIRACGKLYCSYVWTIDCKGILLLSMPTTIDK